MSQKTAEIIVYTTPDVERRKSFEQMCILSVKDPEVLSEFTLGQLIAMFEEETLADLEEENRLNNNNTRSFNTYNSYNSHHNRWGGYYSMFNQKLNILAVKLNVNIKVFIGHIDLCQDYLPQIEKELPDITEPTLILLIGCMGTTYAKSANEKEEWKGSQCAVVAFHDLIHIYDNKIYGCGLNHKSLPNMACDYDGVEADYEELIKKYGEDYTNIRRATYDTTNKLVDCCKKKLDRFSSIFLKGLRKRNCVEFTMDKLEEKMRGLLKEDGTLNREKLENPENYILYSKDGISCANEEDCEINDPFEASVKNADEYNMRSSLLNLYQTFVKDIEDKKDDDDKEKVLLERLQALRPEEKGIVNYKQDGRTILHMFAWYGYPRCLEYLIKKFDVLPIEVIDNQTGNLFIEDFISNDYNSEEDKLRVLIKFHEKFPHLLNTDTPGRLDTLFYAVQAHYLSIITYLSEYTRIKFYRKIYNIGKFTNATLLFAACDGTFLVDETSYNIIKLLLTKKVDPNGNAVDTDYNSPINILEFYFLKNLPMINSKILNEFCKYGYNNIATINDIINEINNLLKGDAKVIKFKEYWLDYYYKYHNNSKNYPPEKDRIDTKVHTLVDAILGNLPSVLKKTRKMLEDCKKIIYKGKKTNAQLNINRNRTQKQLKNNLNQLTRKLFAHEEIPLKYQEIDNYIKTVGVKFTPDEKKKFRAEGIAIVQNKTGNALERLEKLENLYTEIKEEVVKRSQGGKGGKRFNITRKKRRT